MEHNMFCFQCEQTAGCSGCVGKAGVCGKTAVTAGIQDRLTGALIGLARASEGKDRSPEADRIIVKGLFATLTNVSFDDNALNELLEEAGRLKDSLSPMCGSCTADCGRTEDFDMNRLWSEDEDIRSLKSLILFGMRGMAAYAYHAMVLGHEDRGVMDYFYKGLFAVGYDGYTVQDLLPIVMELGAVNLDCMAMLDRANRQAFGIPSPAQVSLTVEPGPFIVISGHDLHDLKLLLEQTRGKGINVYTHGEMLPAHAYPELRKYSHLKGNFGTAWQNQQKEFADLPAPVLFTTNCLMPPKSSYSDRVFTTALVSYPGMVHIDGRKDFSPVIQRALELGGFREEVTLPGINGGTMVTGRNYYTDFVKQTPEDTLILTLACGKYRFNDLELGSLAGIPRLLDMGQCNDAFGAIQVAIALAEAFGCSVNDLPLTLVLSWYEQKAVCILLSLLHLGIKNIYLGPTLPAFLSPAILGYLVEQFEIHPISTPEKDLAMILA